MTLEKNSQQALNAQGSNGEKEDQSGGTTNLSLDQSNNEHGFANISEDNPNGIENPDDLHEIQVGDDLHEPDVEEFEQDEKNLPEDIDRQEGFDEGANPVETNS